MWKSILILLFSFASAFFWMFAQGARNDGTDGELTGLVFCGVFAVLAFVLAVFSLPQAGFRSAEDGEESAGKPEMGVVPTFAIAAYLVAVFGWILGAILLFYDVFLEAREVARIKYLVTFGLSIAATAYTTWFGHRQLRDYFQDGEIEYAKLTLPQACVVVGMMLAWNAYWAWICRF